MDVREVGDSAVLVAVFGRNIAGRPEKYTMVCEDSVECEKLKDAINQAVLE